MRTIEKYIGSSVIIWSPCFIIFFFFLSGLFLPLNVLLAVCRLEGGHDTSILLFNQRVKLYCLTMIIFCKIFSLLFLTYSNLLIFILSYFC